MGFSLDRIDEDVDDEFKCEICRSLLENPVVLSDCEHIFCAKCINEWLSAHLTCPLDNKPVTHSQIKAAPKVIQKIISKFSITCDFAANGCQSKVKVDQLMQHISECQYNPEKMIKCRNGCGTLMLSSYNCMIRHESVCDKNKLSTNAEKAIECLEVRVKALEIENSILRKDLQIVKSLIGYVETETKSTVISKGKLMVKIDDKTLAIDADPREPISVIKQKVQQMANISANDLLVFFANKELDEKRTLIDYHIYKLSNPLFLLMVKRKIKIFVRIDRNKEYPIEVSPKNKVSDILAKILKKEALVSKNLVLSYRNQQLDENRTLFSYKIRDGNFIFLNTLQEIEERRAALSE